MPRHQLAARTGRRRAQVHDPRIRELRPQRLPTVRDVVTPLVEQNQIEEVVRQRFQPTVGSALKLVNVRDHHVGLVEIPDVRRCTTNFGRFSR